MPDKSEIERRKTVMIELRKKAGEEFESSLPKPRDLFKKLFDYLDIQFGEKACDNTLLLTVHFLKTNNIINSEMVVRWIQEHGGGCDCEVLADIEDSFED
jgi:Protein of unknown function (DUF2695)